MNYFRIGEPPEPTPYGELNPQTRKVVDELHRNPYLSYAEALETASRTVSENAADELRRKMEAEA